MSIAFCCAVVLYVSSFIYHFNIFSAPVRSSNGFGQGPLARGVFLA